VYYKLQRGNKMSTPETPEAPAEQVAPTETTLTLQDITVAMQMITVISARGAFKPDELAVVGALYNKLHAFLEASGALTEDAVTDTTTEEVPTPE